MSRFEDLDRPAPGPVNRRKLIEVLERSQRKVKRNGQSITAATYTSAGPDDINKDRHVLKAEA